MKFASMAFVLALASCEPHRAAITAADPPSGDGPPKVVIMPDAPDDGVICVVLAPSAERAPSTIGVHCITIGELRDFLGSRQKAE